MNAANDREEERRGRRSAERKDPVPPRRRAADAPSRASVTAMANGPRASFAQFARSAADVVSARKTVFLLGYFALSSAFFCVQFSIMRNWDMLVRILDADYLFHHGYYFEPERELLESVVIGILSFPLGDLAVYGFIVAGALLLFFALREFSKAFSIDHLVAAALFLNPFFLFYGVMNGSEIYLLSFVLLTLAEIKKGSSLAGFYLALAFVSKYDTLYFVIPFVFFLPGVKIGRGLGRLLLSIAVFLVTLTPFFVYNLLTYGNLVYTFALAYLNFSVMLPSLPYFVYNGLLELALPLGLLVWLCVARGKNLRQSLRGRTFDALLLLTAFAIGLYIYYKTHNLMVHGLSTYRWGTMALSFSMLLVAMMVTKAELPVILGFSVCSFLAACLMLAFAYRSASAETAEAKAAVAAFTSIYGTTHCTVYSNDWVVLDYYGLPAASLPSFETPYHGDPVVAVGRRARTSYELLYRRGNVAIYGDRGYCSFHKVTVDYLDRRNAALAHQGEKPEPADPCVWLFGMRPKIPALQGACGQVSALVAGRAR